ncbi:hypothetical protein K437DRAFT_229870, partial [Tilletiaria anomala UBC 951]
LLRKLHLYIGLPIGILFLLRFPDRSSLSNAISANLPTDLNVPRNGANAGDQRNHRVVRHFRDPQLAPLPKTGHHRLSSHRLSLATLVTSFISSYAGLIATRVLIGAAKSGFVPILAIYLADFYRSVSCASAEDIWMHT